MRRQVHGANYKRARVLTYLDRGVHLSNGDILVGIHGSLQLQLQLLTPSDSDAAARTPPLPGAGIRDPESVRYSQGEDWRDEQDFACSSRPTHSTVAVLVLARAMDPGMRAGRVQYSTESSMLSKLVTTIPRLRGP